MPSLPIGSAVFPWLGQKEIPENGYRIIVNTGPDGHQEVPIFMVMCWWSAAYLQIKRQLIE